MKGYLSIQETSYKWGISERRVNQYAAEGRIPGAKKFGRSWAIPDTAEKPEDPRRIKKRGDRL
ncbi:MAG: DNA-binding protein [Clostridia bacterium]|nr:DNA-binding protein [Clostridia bacterium]